MKMTMMMIAWAHDRGNRLQFALELRQHFNSSVVLSVTPQQGTTSMFLFSQAGSGEGALIRLLEFGLADSVVVSCVVSLAGRMVSITFDYFDDGVLEYDPGNVPHLLVFSESSLKRMKD